MNTVLVYVLLATLGEYDEKITGIPRDELIRRTVKEIRYIAYREWVCCYFKESPKDYFKSK